MAFDAEAPGPDPIDVATGLNIRAARKKAGMSQEQLGRALGITCQQIQKYERGTNRISASMLVKSARALKVSAASLLPAEEAQPAAPNVLTALANLRGLAELAELYGRLSAGRRKLVLRLALLLCAEEA